MATEKLKKRDRNHAIVDSAVKLHDKIILILSEDSLEKDWAENEYNSAIVKEMRSGITSLVPIILDDAVKNTDKPWAIKMRRSRYLYDFAVWQDPEAYGESLGCLLDGLSAEEMYTPEEFSEEEEVAREDLLSEKMKEIRARELAQEFRADRRQLC